MTKKESFYYELMKVQNEVSMIKNNRPFWNENLEEYITTTTFRKKADQLTMKKLEAEMKIWQGRLEQLNAKKALTAWLETTEGKEYIQKREDEMKALHAKVLDIREDARKHTSALVKQFLGEQWDVTRFTNDCMGIAIIEKYREDGRPVELFGHEFDINFGLEWEYKGAETGWEKKHLWSMNYGTMGSFDITENNTRIQYLVGMTKFISDTTVIPELRNYLHNMTEEIREIDERYYELEKEVKNPVKPE